MPNIKLICILVVTVWAIAKLALRVQTVPYVLETMYLTIILASYLYPWLVFSLQININKLMQHLIKILL
jgi:hypothetical protein